MIFTDIKKAVNYYKLIREERRKGIEIEPAKRIPLISQGYNLINTVEGCTIYKHKDIKDHVREAYKTLSAEDRRYLSFSPKQGEFIERANIWRKLLYPVLSAHDYHKTMRIIIHRYIEIKNLNTSYIIKAPCLSEDR